MAYRYMQGDYMRGYRGDPGIFSFLKKTVGGIAGVVSRTGIPIVSQAAGIVSGAIGSRASGSASRQIRAPMMNIQRSMPVVRTPGVRGAMQRLVPGGATGYQVDPVTGEVKRKRKRMNPANPKALRRAIRRQAGFVKLARRALQGSGYKIVSKGAGRTKRVIKEAGPGSVYVQ